NELSVFHPWLEVATPWRTTSSKTISNSSTATGCTIISSLSPRRPATTSFLQRSPKNKSILRVSAAGEQDHLPCRCLWFRPAHRHHVRPGSVDCAPDERQTE